MAVSCVPADLMAASKCFQECLTPEQVEVVSTYLLAVIAGLPTDRAGVQTLVTSAKCFKTCMTPEQRELARTYLLCKIAGG